jgi:hypothetical protein
MEHHCSYIPQNKFLAYLPMELKLEIPFLPQRLLYPSKSHQLKKSYLENYLRTI